MKALVRRWIPPVLWDAAKGVRETLGGPEWRAAPGGFAEARGLAGWDVPSVTETQAARWQDFVARATASGPLAFSGETAPSASDEAAHNSMMVFGYSLARAAHGHERMTMLDWGGGLGQYGVLARALMPEVVIDYHCRDLPGLVARGRTLQPEATFHERDEDAFARPYDFVLASASLHYREDWRDALAALARATRGFLLVTRLPVVLDAPSYVAIQRPHAYGYRTAYAGWVLKREEFLGAASGAGLALAREFLIQEHPRIVGAPGACHYRGFLFRSGA